MPPRDKGASSRGNGSTLESSDSPQAFGAARKTFRERALLTREQLAGRPTYSPASVASVEQGRRMPSAGFVEGAEEALEAFGVRRAMARHVRWQRGLAVRFREWARLEETAAGLCTYECRVAPGLLQTEAYTRAVMLNVPLPPSEEQLEQRIAARKARQELLTRRPPTGVQLHRRGAGAVDAHGQRGGHRGTDRSPPRVDGTVERGAADHAAAAAVSRGDGRAHAASGDPGAAVAGVRGGAEDRAVGF